ncbi:hypothetical protein HKX48_008628 [Thoreauomyces humboldtii]|nr:hypothetical protein HKX48_008628 [Thoreauomyces humboldtii]
MSATSSRPSVEIVEKTPAEKAPFADNPTKGLVPLSATEIFLTRLGGWSQLVRRLIFQFEMILDHQKRLAEAYARCAREFATPITDAKGDPVFSRAETCQVLFSNIQAQHARTSDENTDASAMLENHVLPTLRSMLTDLRRKSQDADREWTSLDKELARDKDIYVKLAAQLQSALAKHNGESYDGQDGKDTSGSVIKDPWAANLNLKRHIATCVYKQDHYRAVLLAQQDHFATFESTIVQTLRVTLSSFFDWQKKDLDVSQDSFKKLKSTLHTIDVKKDWEAFRTRNLDRFVERDCPLLSEPQIAYQGREDPLIAANKEGLLYRRDTGIKFGFRKSWKETLVVVTTANYLHALPPQALSQPANLSSSSLTEEKQEEVASRTEPELSLYLPDCVIGPLMMNEKEPEEFVVQQKAGGMFGGEKKHKGANMDQSAMWWGYLSERVRMAKLRQELLAPSSPLSTSAGTATSPSSPSGRPPPAVPRPRTSSTPATDPLSGAPIQRTVNNTAPAPPPVDPLTGSPLLPRPVAGRPVLQPVRPGVVATPQQPASAPNANGNPPEGWANFDVDDDEEDDVIPAPPQAPSGDPSRQPPHQRTSTNNSEDSQDNTPLAFSLPSHPEPPSSPQPATKFITTDPSLSLADQMEAALTSPDYGFSPSPHEADADNMWSDHPKVVVNEFGSAWDGDAGATNNTSAPLDGLDEDYVGTGAWA